jgi:uncharacterized membrane protein YwaF
MGLIFLLNVIALILGGLLAASGLIIAKKPNAKELIDKLVPFQVLIGVAMLGLGVVNLLLSLANGVLTALTHTAGLFGLTVLVVTGASILLGVLFGLPQFNKWMQGHGNAQQKTMEFAHKVAPFQGSIGLIGLAASLLALLYYFHILSIATF